MSKSRGGGNLAVWSKDGKELYYYRGADLMAVDIDTTDGFTAGAPRVLFRSDSREMFDVSPDGERFVMVRNDETSQPRINVVLNWFSELERLVPTDD